MNKQNKIGILTFSYPENMNYGAMLQSYATYTFLEKNGYTPTMIDYNETPKMSKKTLVFVLLHRLFGIWGFRKFFKKNFKNRTKRCSSYKDLKHLNISIDCFIVGSDQVWRYLWIKERVKHYFLDFASENSIKIAYAASFGIKMWNEAPENITSHVSNLIKRFDSISVREASGVNICKDVFGVDAHHVLDPTFLLEQQDYDKIISNKEIICKNSYIAYMLLDKNVDYLKFIDDLSEEQSLERINIKGKTISFLRRKFCKYNSISFWLNAIKNADYVVTDSFHCVAFAIIYKKQFVCLGNKVRGLSRLESLLKMCGLKDRLYYDVKDIKLSDISNYTIDYENVGHRLKSFKEMSMEFLLGSLKK